jgi:hypothetical protein
LSKAGIVTDNLGDCSGRSAGVRYGPTVCRADIALENENNNI